MTARYWLQRHPWLYLWLPVVVWMGVIFALSAQPDLPNPETGWRAELLSIGAHVLAFGLLAVLWARALGNRSRVMLVAFVVTMLYALSDEFHQAHVPGRHADPLDLVYDGVGAALGLSLWVWLQSREGG